MARINCFDVVKIVTEEATSRFAPLFRENREAKNILHQYCEVLDALAQEFDGESFEVEVDEIQMTIGIKLECPDIVIQSDKHRFYALARRALEIRFSHGENDTVAVEFVFPSIWEKTA